MTLVLFREEDKENKIKSNRKNIVNYLKAQDLWDKDKYKDLIFNENLNELKKINIQINQILYIVDIKEEDISDIKGYNKNEEEKNKQSNQNTDNKDNKESDSEKEEEESENESENSDDDRTNQRM